MKFLKPYLSYALMCLSVYWEIVKDTAEAATIYVIEAGERHYAVYVAALAVLVPLVWLSYTWEGIKSAWRRSFGSLTWAELTPKFWRDRIRKDA